MCVSHRKTKRNENEETCPRQSAKSWQQQLAKGSVPQSPIIRHMEEKKMKENKRRNSRVCGINGRKYYCPFYFFHFSDLPKYFDLI